MTASLNELADRVEATGPDVLALADHHERLALGLAEHVDRGSITKAAAHFAVAEALRSRARYVK